eukprot:CAMPEP_0174376718 /NCGR_PEP_ID=MMETSP0811_2-20130205/119245_1 /TAXON_ID=73025 ORGANISM="Eutreptiella gymnastica-like, Strain CCMP1594" /NCGR_SAMPLE_ID=MMETSP0811_2 /ASSEMBLY_ACC=CAM_ASM_000667 /LENGTH=58 /DNA_ID=CAMNT_0015528197 /DNA_START=223 /DNA_END=399 /DNA_ORIENTATION=+
MTSKLIHFGADLCSHVRYADSLDDSAESWHGKEAVLRKHGCTVLKVSELSQWSVVSSW